MSKFFRKSDLNHQRSIVPFPFLVRHSIEGLGCIK